MSTQTTPNTFTTTSLGKLEPELSSDDPYANDDLETDIRRLIAQRRAREQGPSR